MRLRRIAVTAIALGMLFLFPGTSMGDSYRVRAVGSVGSFEWDPDFRGIRKGDRIVWKNTTTATHRVVAYRGPWSKNSEIGPGETTRKRFRKTGAYYYRCTVPGHSTLSDGNCTGMCGHIHVSR
jgi:plastocyanin